MSSDASFTSQQDTSRKSGTWSIAFILLITILIMAIPRIFGPSWRSIITPMDMRVLDHNQIQWEGFLVLRSVQMTLSSDTPNHVREFFSTDEYRAILPIFLAAIATKSFDSYFWGATISELIWWWAGSISTAVLSRRLGCNWYAATGTGILTATSPIAVAHIGALHLHTASSMALPVATLIAWDALHSVKRSLLINTLITGFAIFISSITYTYQWVLVPWLLGLTLMARQPVRWVLTVISSVIAFTAFTAIARATLQLGGLTVHAHPNDPIEVLTDRVRSQMLINQLDSLEVLISFFTIIWRLLLDMLVVYHPLIMFLSLVGLINTNKLHIFLYFFTILIAILQSIIYPLPWVLMSAFPFIYISASIGVSFIGTKWRILYFKLFGLSFRFSRFEKFVIHPLFIIIIIIIIAIIVTNSDLIGDDAFVIRWWGRWYVYH